MEWTWRYRDINAESEAWISTSYRASKPSLAGSSLGQRLLRDFPGTKLIDIYPLDDVFVISLTNPQRQNSSLSIHASAEGAQGSLPGGHDAKSNKEFLQAFQKAFAGHTID